MVAVVRGEPSVEREAPSDFVACYDRSVTEVYSYLFSRLRDRPVTEDLTQEVFLAEPAARQAVRWWRCRG